MAWAPRPCASRGTRAGGACHGIIAIAALVFAIFPLGVRAATVDEVDKAVERAVAYLKAGQKGGVWEFPPTDALAIPRNKGGLTALVTSALLAAGEKPQNEQIKSAVDFLMKLETRGTYVIALRSQVWLLLPDSPARRAAVERDAKLLTTYVIQKTGNYSGTYGYELDQVSSDHSNSQFGVLGAWALEQAGAAIPESYWKLIDDHWRSLQREDGGWSYYPAHQGSGEWQVVTPSMTLAGVATLFITQDYLLRGQKFNTCTGGVRNDNIENGLLWLDKHVEPVLDGAAGGKYPYYALYGVERVGVASGRKYFGTIDWYQRGADFLVRGQRPDGSWGNLHDTAFALLFLVRGRAPILFNKLEWSGRLSSRDHAASLAWNERPRDVANLAKWTGRRIETFLNWQVVNLAAPVEDLHDAPILYIAGGEAPAFTDEETDKLRRFVEQGGMILGNADCGREAFTTAFRKLGARLFPKYPFRPLPADHPIFTNEQYPAKKWKNKPRVLGLSNGVRELMLLLPDADPSRSWQLELASRPEAFELAANIFLYAVDKKGVRSKGETYIVKADESAATKTLKVARLEVGDNWDPEPAGWPRFANILHNAQHVALQVDAVKPGEGKLAGYRVAHLTGTGKFALADAQRQEIKGFVEGGGTLIVDAAGGGADFASAAEQELGQTFGEAAAKELSAPLPPDSPVYAAGVKTTEVAYRAFARRAMAGGARSARLRGITIGGRLAVFFSREDLTAALVGEPVDGITGYEPKSAAQLMTNMLLHAAEKGGRAGGATDVAGGD